MTNRLYFGDNLQVLRSHLADATVDLIYLDPPFNSKRDYNLLFKAPKVKAKATKTAGAAATLATENKDMAYGDAQITAFEDTWHWGQQAEDEFKDILKCGNTDVSELMSALRSFLKENDLMAYLTMMCSRLLEMHRVLKPTGSLYLHCDPTASHYLKIVLDGIFGKENYRTEISWKRSTAHSDAKQGRQQYGNIRDVIFFYTKSSKWQWNWLYTKYSGDYLSKMYRHVEPLTERLYRLDNLTGPGGAAKGNPAYEVMGITRHWRYSKEKMAQLISQGRILQSKPGTVPAYKRYLDEMPGVPLQNDWQDIPPATTGHEYLGYPTQKPLALLERIISVSSNPGDVVLDPFCGCGTAVHAAQKLGRRWIGIDITHLAISLIEKRLKDAFPGIVFSVEGTPQDLAAAQDLANRDKHQFQLWACTLVGAQPYKGGRKGADGGIDGLRWIEVGKDKTEKVIVQIKGGVNVSRHHIATLKGDVDREKAAIGLFVTLAAPTREMLKEAAAAGHYIAPHKFGGVVDFPKIQVLSIQGLMNGSERPNFPDLSFGEETFKKARKEQGQFKQNELL